MNEPDILYPAIFVFSMLVVGLALTVWEFSRVNKSVTRKAEKRKPAGGPESELGSSSTSALAERGSGAEDCWSQTPLDLSTSL